MKDMNEATDSDTTRRSVLRTLGVGTTALLGVGSLSGSAAAWERNDIDFKGCSEVWIIVAPSDIDPSIYDPPTVAHVIVATADGTLECRLQEFTPETTTTIPGRYGDAPVLKYAPPSGEKVLGVIIYNYSDTADRFERTSPLTLNPHRCANTPGTPDPTKAPCADNTYLSTEDIQTGPGRSNGGGGGPPERTKETSRDTRNGRDLNR